VRDKLSLLSTLVAECQVPDFLIGPRDKKQRKHYLAGSGEMLLAKEALEAEAFRAKLGSENGERYALQFRQAIMQDLRAAETLSLLPPALRVPIL
jgi:hypothetical protein